MRLPLLNVTSPLAHITFCQSRIYVYENQSNVKVKFNIVSIDGVGKFELCTLCVWKASIHTHSMKPTCADENGGDNHRALLNVQGYIDYMICLSTCCCAGNGLSTLDLVDIILGCNTVPTLTLFRHTHSVLGQQGCTMEPTLKADSQHSKFINQHELTNNHSCTF